MIVEISPHEPGAFQIAHIMRKAASAGLQPAVACHLVGAILAIRFPHILIDRSLPTGVIDRHSAQCAYRIGSTEFRLAPDFDSEKPASGSWIPDSELNIYVFLPENAMDRVRSFVEESDLSSRVVVTSVENFAGQILDQIGAYQSERQQVAFASMLTEYNRRVTSAETNLDLRIQATIHGD